jgi:hypothetical protein
MITTRAVPALLPGHHRPVAQLPVTVRMTLPTPWGAEMHKGPVWLGAITRYRRAGGWSARPVSAYRPGRCRRRR